MPYTIIQVSDLHFGTVVPHVADALINITNELSPDFFIVSGDVTQRSLPHQFKEAQAFFDRVQCQQKMILPGNHDIPFYQFWLRILSPTYTFDRYMKSRSKDFFINENIAILGVNSCNPLHYKNGKISDSQLNKIKHKFKDVSDNFIKIIVFHHPLDVFLEEDMSNMIDNADCILEALHIAGIDLVMGGHIHYPFCRSLKHRYNWLERNMAVCQAGTATSRLVRSSKPNSFMRLKIGADKTNLQVEQWDFNYEELKFKKIEIFQPFL